MRLRHVTTRLLVPAAILLAAGGYARAFDLPLQLSQFLTGAHKPKVEKPEPAEETAKPQTPPKRHVARHKAAPKHVAKHAAPMHLAHHAPADTAPSVATAAPAEPPRADAAATPVLPAQAAADPAPANAAAAGAENPAPHPDGTTQYVEGVRVVSADEFNELDAAADPVPANPEKATPTDEINAIERAARPAVVTDGRNPDAAIAAEPAERPAPQLITWPRAVAFGIGGPLLIGLLAWPLIARRRARLRYHWSM